MIISYKLKIKSKNHIIKNTKHNEFISVRFTERRRLQCPLLFQYLNKRK